MLNKYFMAIAIIVFGVVFSQDTFGQKEIVVWKSASSIKSPRDVQAGQVSNRELRPSNRSNETAFTGSDEELGALIAWARAPRPSTSLIDTSTGEVVWADEVRSTRKPATASRSSNLIDTSTGEVVWAVPSSSTPRNTRANGRTRNLIDTSTGEVVW